MNLYQLGNDVPVDDEAIRPRNRLSLDWYGNETEDPFFYTLALSPEFLFFTVQFPSGVSPAADTECGKFIEGLWEHDVAELFLKPAEAEWYIEWNLSPAGAWWCALFSSYRERDRSKASQGVRAWCARADSICEARLQLPLTSLPGTLNWEQSLRGHVSAIRYTTEERYFTTSGAGEGPPDFHASRCFCPVILGAEI